MTMKIHHKSKSEYSCPVCKRTLFWLWEDKEEKNGQLEQTRGLNYTCIDCITKQNDGKPPLGLSDLNEIRKRGITKEQYYKEHGY